LRRMKLAAEAMPILLGGDVDLWCRWIKEMEQIPGALFIARGALPVRGTSMLFSPLATPSRSLRLSQSSSQIPFYGMKSMLVSSRTCSFR
jgi:hypothetical protein